MESEELFLALKTKTKNKKGIKVATDVAPRIQATLRSRESEYDTYLDMLCITQKIPRICLYIYDMDLLGMKSRIF